MFKNVVLALTAALVSSLAMAESLPLTYTCKSANTDLVYVVTPSFGEISVLDKTGVEVRSLDSMSAEYIVLEVFPSIFRTTLRHEEGDEVAHIDEQLGKMFLFMANGEKRVPCSANKRTQQ